MWRQEDTSSLRLFSVDSSGRQMIRNFSLMRRLHLLLELLLRRVRRENAPGNKVFDVVVFEGPDMLAEFGGVSLFSVAERWSGVSLSCFEVVLCESDVRFCRVVVVACDGGLV